MNEPLIFRCLVDKHLCFVYSDVLLTIKDDNIEVIGGKRIYDIVNYMLIREDEFELIMSSNLLENFRHQIRIPYINSKGKSAKYVPDFVMYHLREVHEVKGKMDEDDDLKIAAAEAWCSVNGWTYVFHESSEFS